MNASSLESQKRLGLGKSGPQSPVRMVTPNGDGELQGNPPPPKKNKANSGLGRKENLPGGIRNKPVKTQLTQPFQKIK